MTWNFDHKLGCNKRRWSTPVSIQSRAMCVLYRAELEIAMFWKTRLSLVFLMKMGSDSQIDETWKLVTEKIGHMTVCVQ